MQYNDIAILTLDSPVQFSQQIRPVCLPGASSDYTGRTATVIGWGSLRESKRTALKEQAIGTHSKHWTFYCTETSVISLHQCELFNY